MSAANPTLGETARAARDLVGLGARIGRDLLSTIAWPGRATKCGCSCEIPAPCWEPQPLGAVRSRVCPGGKATVRLRATNCGSSARNIQVKATDPDVKVDPPSIALGPMEQTTFVLAIEMPAGANVGERRDLVVWVHGCKEHYLRWSVEATGNTTDCCSDVAVEDCPDLVHHWYDHFYCQRPCPHQR